MVMELLQTSSRILDVFGHCGTSITTPVMDGHPLPKMIETPNALSPLSKLQIAIQMARSIADLHGHQYGPIVHSDVHSEQWLLDKNNNVVLVDFNRAEPLLWDEENEEYCKFVSGGANGNVRSPEEYKMQHIDEKIDVYSFGMLLYTMLTSKEPYYVDGEEIEDILAEILQENKPIVPEEIRNHSHAEMILADVMDKCIEYDSDKRVNIFTVVSMLEEGLRKNYGSEDMAIEIEWDEIDESEEVEYYYEYYYYDHDTPADEEFKDSNNDQHEEATSTHGELRGRRK